MVTTNTHMKQLAAVNNMICGQYNDGDNSMTLFIGVTGPAPVYSEWSKDAAAIRTAATCKRSILGNMIPDTSAPELKTAPTAAALYLKEVKGFVPAVNVCIYNGSDLSAAYATGQRIASECNLILTRDKTFPEPEKVNGLILHQVEPEPDTGVDAIARRYNSAAASF